MLAPLQIESMEFAAAPFFFADINDKIGGGCGCCQKSNIPQKAGAGLACSSHPKGRGI